MNLVRLVVLAGGLLLGLAAFGAPSVIRLATTTSTENSGLLAVLLPPFELRAGFGLSGHVIAVGTGKALRLAQEGDVDVALVHARADEDDWSPMATA